MTKNTELFLAEFKKLENAVKIYKDCTVLDFENGLPQNLQKEHLKMCRIARNHIVHSDDSFFEPTKKMISFLSDLAREVSLSAGCAKDMMTTFTKFGYVTVDNTIEDAISIIGAKHLDAIPVLSMDMMDCVFVKAHELCGIVYETPKFRTMKMKSVMNKVTRAENITVSQDMPVNDVPEGHLILVSDNKGRLKGVIV